MTRQIALGYGAPSPAILELRIHELERKVAALTEATRLLARALEAHWLVEPGDTAVAQGARRAHELLLAAGIPPAAATPEGTATTN